MERKKYRITSRKETSLQRGVYSDVLRDGAAIASAVWKSSNPKVLEILDEEKMLDNSVIKYGEPVQLVSTRVKAKKSGTVTVTCQIGDKKSSFKVKVNVKAAKKEKAPGRTVITEWKKKGKKAIQVSWKKKTGVTGYQICYAANKSFRKAEKITVKKIRHDCQSDPGAEKKENVLCEDSHI